MDDVRQRGVRKRCLGKKFGIRKVKAVEQRGKWGASFGVAGKMREAGVRWDRGGTKEDDFG